MRLAYGYAQYGYTQRRDFLCTMNASPTVADAVEHCYRPPGQPGIRRDHYGFTVPASRPVHGGRALLRMSTLRKVG